MGDRYGSASVDQIGQPCLRRIDDGAIKHDRSVRYRRKLAIVLTETLSFLWPGSRDARTCVDFVPSLFAMTGCFSLPVFPARVAGIFMCPAWRNTRGKDGDSGNARRPKPSGFRHLRLMDEPRRRILADRRDGQRLAGARHGHVKEAPLFGFGAFLVRHHVFLGTRDLHVVPLQPLRTMHGGEHQRIRCWLVVRALEELQVALGR